MLGRNSWTSLITADFPAKPANHPHSARQQTLAQKRFVFNLAPHYLSRLIGWSQKTPVGFDDGSKVPVRSQSRPIDVPPTAS